MSDSALDAIELIARIDVRIAEVLALWAAAVSDREKARHLQRIDDLLDTRLGFMAIRDDHT